MEDRLMLLQTNSYIVPKERRAEHARLIRRFRQALARIGCDQFEVYEQVGANWSPGGANGRYVQIMRFRDRQHQQAVQAAERDDHGAQHIIAEFCELINFPYQQQHGYFATGFYMSVLPVGPRHGAALEAPVAGVAGVETEYAEEMAPTDEAPAEEAAGEWQEAEEAQPAEEFAAEPGALGAAAGDTETAEPETGEAGTSELAEDFATSELPAASADESAALADTSGEESEEARELSPDAADAIAADAFLDSLNEEGLPSESLAGDGTTAPPEGEPGKAELGFAEVPIASNEAAAQMPADEEVVTADAFIPHDADAAPVEPVEPVEPELGEAELEALEPSEFEAAVESPVAEAQPLSPDEAELAEASAAEPDDLGLAFDEAEQTPPPLPEVNTAPTPIEEPELAPGELPEVESAHADLAEGELAEGELAHFHFDELEPGQSAVESPQASAPEAVAPAPLAAEAPAAEPAAHEADSHGLPPGLLDAPPELPESAAGEADAEEFQLDEGLIFDDEDLLADEASPTAAASNLDPAHPAGQNGNAAEGQPAHDPISTSAYLEDTLEPLQLDGTLPQDAELDALLDDPNMRAHAPLPAGDDHGSDSHRDHGKEAAPAPEAEKDADLLEFDAFLRQLDEEGKHK